MGSGFRASVMHVLEHNEQSVQDLSRACFLLYLWQNIAFQIAACPLQAHEQMQAASIRPDTALYAAVIDLLWMSGIVGAQQRAQQLFQLACRQSVKGVEATQAMWREDEGALEVTQP